MRVKDKEQLLLSLSTRVATLEKKIRQLEVGTTLLKATNRELETDETTTKDKKATTTNKRRTTNSKSTK